MAELRSGTTAELVPLLRRRLRFLSVLFAVLFGLVVLLRLGLAVTGLPVAEGTFWWVSVGQVAFAITAVLAVVLCRQDRWTYHQLRLMELLFFGTLAFFFLGQSCFLYLGSADVRPRRGTDHPTTTAWKRC